MPNHKSIYSASDASSPNVQERGSLRTSGVGQSQFIGSSSGIYFVNKVRKAFRDANVHQTADLSDDLHPSPEECIVPDDDDARLRSADQSEPASRDQSVPPGLLSYGHGIPLELGRPPPPQVARKLFIAYFQTWHRFFPFLHGPSVANDMELLYGTKPQESSQAASRGTTLPLARVVILQCLFNLASLRTQGVDLPLSSRINKPGMLLSCLLSFAVKGDIISIQSLFATQLLLVARMSLRMAVLVAGLLSRAIFLAGLHRCPFRYRELSEQDCDIRKRLFWCIYVLDRFLSQALGHPLGLQDSDIDVCLPLGPELHPRSFHFPNEPDSNRTPVAEAEDCPEALPTTPRDAQSQRSNTDGSNLARERHQILAFQVEFARLSGRALELFHKSIHIRSIDPRSVLSLKTDLDACWNSLPYELQEFNSVAEESPLAENSSQPFSAPALFSLLHSQIRLLIHRPWLSLDPATPEFQSALQICIGLARDIILNMRKQHRTGCSIFWSGYLSASWMAGIILVFACHLHQYSTEKGQKEITLCLDVLEEMSGYWPSAKNCHTVLSDLLHAGLDQSETPLQSQASYPLAACQSRDEQFSPNRARRTFNGAHANDRNKRRRTNPEGSKDHMSVSQSSSAMLSVNNGAGIFIPQNSQLQGHEHADTGSYTPSMGGQSAAFQQTYNLNGELVGSPGLTQFAAPDAQRQPDEHQKQQKQQQQQQRNPLLSPSANPSLGVQSAGRGADLLGLPNATLRDEIGPWTNFSGLGNWDGGMADVLQGATWESLMHVANQDHLDWDSQFL